MLFAAARDDHVRTLIRPALRAGKWVICDRFIDSTRVYQGALGNVDPQADPRARAHHRRRHHAGPDLHPRRAGRGRPARAPPQRRGKTARRPLREPRRSTSTSGCARPIWHIAASEPERCVVIDAARRSDAVADDIWARGRQRGSIRPPRRRRSRTMRTVSAPTTIERRDVAASARDRACCSATPRPSRRCSSLPQRPHAARLADRRAARHRQGDARLSLGALRARASRSAAPAVQRRDIARRSPPTIRSRAASPRRRMATCWCWSAPATSRRQALRTVITRRRGAAHGRASSARPAGEGGWRVAIVDAADELQRRRRQRAAENAGGAAARARCSCWSATRRAGCCRPSARAAGGWTLRRSAEDDRRRGRGRGHRTPMRTTPTLRGRAGGRRQRRARRSLLARRTAARPVRDRSSACWPRCRRSTPRRCTRSATASPARRRGDAFDDLRRRRVRALARAARLDAAAAGAGRLAARSRDAGRRCGTSAPSARGRDLQSRPQAAGFRPYSARLPRSPALIPCRSTDAAGMAPRLIRCGRRCRDRARACDMADEAPLLHHHRDLLSQRRAAYRPRLRGDRDRRASPASSGSTATTCSS